MAKTLRFLALSSWALVCLFPIYWLAIASLKDEAAIVHGPTYVPFLDFQPSLEAWRFILFDSFENLRPALANSLWISTIATLIVILFATLFLYGNTRLSSNRSNTLYIAILASRILPPVVLALPLYMMGSVTGLLDTRTGLIFVYAAINLPVAVWLLLPILGTKACEQEEAALLEGVSHIRVLFEILLPMLLQSLMAVALLIFVLCWNEYLFVAYLTTNHANTLTPWMVGQLSIKEAQVGSEAEELAHLSAAATLMIAPLLLFSGLLQRFIGRMSHWKR